MYFRRLLLKSNNFTFDEDTSLLSGTACLDELVAGFSENIGTSAPNLRCGWAKCIFGCLLIRVNHFAFDKILFFRPETPCLERWLAGITKNVAISASNYNLGRVLYIF